MSSGIKTSLLKEDKDFCIRILPQVSRTFAINIKFLRDDLRMSVVVAYLFCRISDTYEDSSRLGVSSKIEALRTMGAVVASDVEVRPFFVATLPQEVSEQESENELLRELRRVLNVFDHFPATHQKIIRIHVLKMLEGMECFVERYKDVVILETEEELREYCYYVAGVVGELLTDLFLLDQRRHRDTLEKYKVNFGLGLQLTNIIKDFLDDSKRGVSYIPRSLLNQYGLSYQDFVGVKNKEKNRMVLKTLIEKTRLYLNDALKYSLALGRYDKRLFCLIPLFLAAATLRKLAKNDFHQPYRHKISRGEVFRILVALRLITPFNFLVRAFYSVIDRGIKREIKSP